MIQIFSQHWRYLRKTKRKNTALCSESSVPISFIIFSTKNIYIPQFWITIISSNAVYPLHKIIKHQNHITSIRNSVAAKSLQKQFPSLLNQHFWMFAKNGHPKKWAFFLKEAPKASKWVHVCGNPPEIAGGVRWEGAGQRIVFPFLRNK